MSSLLRVPERKFPDASTAGRENSCFKNRPERSILIQPATKRAHPIRRQRPVILAVDIREENVIRDRCADKGSACTGKRNYVAGAMGGKQ